MNRTKTFRTLAILSALTVLLLSLPFLVPGSGILALVGLVPLLAMERIASREGVRRFWMWHYGTFLLWNAVTTWWVCHATVGGGIFAMTANALQMSLIFGFFRLVKKRIGGVVPYLLLAALWIAWERFYLVAAEISWPWLVLGNAFAGDISLIQWYEYTGALGGSLWVWAVNLGIFGVLTAVVDGKWSRMLPKARLAVWVALPLFVFGPIILSLVRWYGYEEKGEPLPFLVVQPNIDPYAKFQAGLQGDYDAALCAAVDQELLSNPVNGTLLVVAPETFTWGLNPEEASYHATHVRLTRLAAAHPEVAMNILYGASTYSHTNGSKPSRLARFRRGGWEEQHNAALMTDASGRADYYNKSKLVVGVEMTPYPAIFVTVDDWLGGVMGRNVGQDRRTALDVVTAEGKHIPVGCAVCYESVYGEFCTEYIRDAGAQLLSVITNDGWWGDTPGYRQHLRYSSLRAIETRRDVVRCGNTGISALIDQRGRILSETPWWEPAVLTGTAHYTDGQTFFVRHGDITGRICVFLALLLSGLWLVRVLTGRKD